LKLKLFLKSLKIKYFSQKLFLDIKTLFLNTIPNKVLLLASNLGIFLSLSMVLIYYVLLNFLVFECEGRGVNLFFIKEFVNLVFMKRLNFKWVDKVIRLAIADKS
jgi:hypothetical protein